MTEGDYAGPTDKWWSEYRPILPTQYEEFIALEAAAVHLHQVHPTIVPGLLQTEAYARAIVAEVALGPLADQQRDALVALRLRRQREVLSGTVPPDLDVVVDEAALRRLVGGAAIMTAQLERLIDVSEQPRIGLAVMPFTAGGHVAMQGGFHLMDFADRASVVFLETARGHVQRTDAEEVEQYRERLASIRARALTGDAAVAFLRQIAADLT
jgi:hypothetical protein